MSCFIELLRHHEHDFLHQYESQLNHPIRQAIKALLRCRTSEQHKMSWGCAHCHHQAQHPLSCGHRHCPQCQHQTTTQWLQRQEQKLLPCHYFMVTFTLPFELRVLARYQPKILYQTMFKVVSKVLKGFAARQFKAEIGFTMVLHTHNRRRDLHPHIHVIMPCGYYDAHNNQWHKGRQQYLFNEFALAKVWRAQMLEAINRHTRINLPAKYPKKWVVDCRKVGFGDKAYQYLSRYLYRGVLSDNDIVHYDENTVTFKYQESKTKQTVTRTLPVLKFLWLILQHVLPKGLQRVRDCGYLRGNASKLRQRIQILLINTKNWKKPKKKDKPKAIRICPCCQHPMHCEGVINFFSRPS